MMKLFILLPFLLGLTACSTLSTVPKPKNVATATQNHAQQMQALVSFNVHGRVGIHTNTNEGGSAAFDWQQQQAQYHVHLTSPLGQTIFDLTGNAQAATLQTATGERMTATSPEALLVLKTGWHMPVTSLIYWIRGIPVPNQPLFTEYDPYGRLTRLNQPPDWQIQYIDYQTVNGMDLPQHITLTSKTATLKFAISHWQVG